MTVRMGNIYNKDTWERMVMESCGSQFTNSRIFKKKYAVCVETNAGTDVIIHWTDDRNYPLKQGQFLVDDGTRTVVEDEGLKERFEELHQRLRDLS